MTKFCAAMLQALHDVGSDYEAEASSSDAGVSGSSSLYMFSA